MDKYIGIWYSEEPTRLRGRQIPTEMLYKQKTTYANQHSSSSGWGLEEGLE